MSQAFETWKSMNAADRKVFAPLTVNVADDNTIAVPAYPFQEIQVAEVSAPASFQGVHLTKVCPLISTSSPVQLMGMGLFSILKKEENKRLRWRLTKLGLQVRTHYAMD